MTKLRLTAGSAGAAARQSRLTSFLTEGFPGPQVSITVGLIRLATHQVILPSTVVPACPRLLLAQR